MRGISLRTRGTGVSTGTMQLLRITFAVLSVCVSAAAQSAPAAAPSQQEIYAALTGRWVGVLQYRDYQSDGRVELPTWLEITPAPDGKSLRLAYTFDDGPTKTVRETDTLAIDPAAATWTITSDDGKTMYSVEGLAAMHSARGKLTLAGKGTDNDKPADVRENVLLGRNIFSMERTVRTGDDKQFLFRHKYVFTREQPPAGK